MFENDYKRSFVIVIMVIKIDAAAYKNSRYNFSAFWEFPANVMAVTL
jgi:hypothetical protein